MQFFWATGSKLVITTSSNFCSAMGSNAMNGCKAYQKNLLQRKTIKRWIMWLCAKPCRAQKDKLEQTSLERGWECLVSYLLLLWRIKCVHQMSFHAGEEVCKLQSCWEFKLN
jgi:hypothetical protein